LQQNPPGLYTPKPFSKITLFIFAACLLARLEHQKLGLVVGMVAGFPFFGCFHFSLFTRSA